MLYPSTSIFTRKGVAHLPPQKLPPPTDAPPGSPEKVRELERRASAGEHLFRPGDATGENVSVSRLTEYVPVPVVEKGLWDEDDE